MVLPRKLPQSPSSPSAPTSQMMSSKTSSHTNYGMGSRVPYPLSAARDALKAGLVPEPYRPVSFTAPVVLANAWAMGKPPAQSWADPEDPNEIPDQITSGRKRVMPYGNSLTNCPFERDSSNLPINPMGKTGITGRGELGLWGPNPAADPIIFRSNKDKTLSVLLVQRADGSKQWAFPGGMVDPTDSTISATAARECREETGLTLENLAKYSLGEIYRGYVDDARNTDNAWMETNAFAWLLPFDVPSNKIKIFDASTQSDETLSIMWVPVTDDLLQDGKLFASHGAILRAAIQKLSG